MTMGYILKMETESGQHIHCSKTTKKLHSLVDERKPLCYELYSGTYHRGVSGRMVVDEMSRLANSRLALKYTNELTMEKVQDFLRLFGKTDKQSYAYFINNFGMTENDNLRMYYKLRELDLLTVFDPTSREYALDFSKIELWKKYKCSRFWKKYYESDCVREKFAKLGINFDELDENSEIDESDILE